MAAKTEPEKTAASQQSTDVDRGYRGVAVDDRPNEAYTVKGVTSS